VVSINYRDPRPIYEQVKDGFRKLMVSGTLREDEKLPSVRELASELAINPNTIQRAYRELESEGYIYSVPGKGSFAAGKKEVDEGRKNALLGQFDEAVTELSYLGVSGEELCRRIREGAKQV
jgi:GntR family transcriptional regulator